MSTQRDPRTKSSAITALDLIIRGSLQDLVDDVFRSGWFGREREVVSLHAFGYLQGYCQAGRILSDPTQIGVEVAVPQIPEPGRKQLVCKDLVIWPEPGMTCWNGQKEPVNYPIAILEWKVNKTSVSTGDVNWLRAFSQGLDDFVGYAVCLDLEERRYRLSCTRVYRGQAEPKWLYL